MHKSKHSDARIMHCPAAHVYMCDSGEPEAGRKRCAGCRSVSRTRHEQRELRHLWMSLPLQGFFGPDLTAFPGCKHLSGVAGWMARLNGNSVL